MEPDEYEIIRDIEYVLENLESLLDDVKKSRSLRILANTLDDCVKVLRNVYDVITEDSE